MAFFDCLQADLISQQHNRNSIAQRLGKLLRDNNTPVTGLYLWGGVGRGKTWMMDLFFDTLPFEEKIRLHFHHFMQASHVQG